MKNKYCVHLPDHVQKKKDGVVCLSSAAALFWPVTLLSDVVTWHHVMSHNAFH